MRQVLTLVFLSISFLSSGQIPSGVYVDHFGHTLKINKDNTFKIEWQFDLANNWSTGQWRISNDTIYLRFVKVYDTLVRENKPDSLVLSATEKSTSINEQQYAIRCISSINQRTDITDRLYLRGKQLFLVDKNGRLEKGKKPGMMKGTKYSTSYTRTK